LKFLNNGLDKNCFTSLATEFDRRPFGVLAPGDLTRAAKKPRSAATFSFSRSMASHRDWPGCAFIFSAKDFMNFITTGAFFDRAKAIRTALPQARRRDTPRQPYAFLTASDLRFMVAAMVD